MASDSYIETELDRLCDEVGEWSVQQFGAAQPPSYSLIGIGEEVGELTRSVLKRAQEIDDGDGTKYADRDDVGPDAERDAVGDIVIYLCDTVYRSPISIDMNRAVSHTEWLNVRSVERVDEPLLCVRSLYGYYGSLTNQVWEPIDTDTDSDNYSSGRIEREIGQFCLMLGQFCAVRGYDIDRCIRDAWSDVSGRTW
jgi:hypothetical protein